MKVAILGAGITGLTTAYELNKQGHEVWIFEKNDQPGGAASGFKQPGWNWYLDYHYHHWFTSDYEILNLCKEIGFNQIVRKRPITATLYSKLKTKNEKGKTTAKNEPDNYYSLFGKNTQVCKLDSPIDLLKFDRLSPFNRLRTGLVLAWLKYGPYLNKYDQLIAKEWLTRYMGKESFQVLWEPLFKKKFENYWQQINLAFFWARIKKRTPTLAYPKGGYQEFVNYFGSVLKKKGVKIKYGCEVKNVERGTKRKDCEVFTLYALRSTFNFDSVVNTFPSPIHRCIGKRILPEAYIKQISKIKYLGAQTLIFQTKKPILDKVYWLNIAASPTSSLDKLGTSFDPVKHEGFNWMVAVQHTNFMDQKHFGNKHLLYLTKYTNYTFQVKNGYKQKTQLKTERNNRYLNKLFSSVSNRFQLISSRYIKYAQPLYTPDYIKYKPDYLTPIKGLYNANLELTYPYDRGTNYAVKVGQKVAKIVKNS